MKTATASPLREFQNYIRGNMFIDKTLLTHCTFKQGAIKVTERRLWIWFCDDTTPILVKEKWLTGDHKKDLTTVFSEWLHC